MYSILNQLIPLLEKYLDEAPLDKAGKLAVVKILDKMILQKELMELKIEVSHSIEDLKIAAHRLGKKSQSAFGDHEV